MNATDLRSALEQLLEPQQRGFVEMAERRFAERRRVRLTVAVIAAMLLLGATAAAAITDVSTGISALDRLLGREATSDGGRLAGVQLQATDDAGHEWVAAGFRHRQNPQLVCVAAALRGQKEDLPVGGGTCANVLPLLAAFDRVGVRLQDGRSAATAAQADSYPLFGLASSEAERVELRDRAGHLWEASLSAVFATVKPSPETNADLVDPGAEALRPVGVRAVLAVLPREVEPGSLVVETQLTSGKALRGHP